MVEQQQADSLLTPAEVAALFRVNPKTVTRWHAQARSRPSAHLVATVASGRQRSVVASTNSTSTSEDLLDQLRVGRPIRVLLVVGAGVDPATSHFSGARSTN